MSVSLITICAAAFVAVFLLLNNLIVSLNKDLDSSFEISLNVVERSAVLSPRAKSLMYYRSKQPPTKETELVVITTISVSK